MKKIIIEIIFCLTFISNIFSQNVFVKKYPININNEFNYISQLTILPDTGYIFSTTAYNDGNNNILIGRTDKYGEVKWTKQIDDDYQLNIFFQVNICLSNDFYIYVTYSAEDSTFCQYFSIVLKMDTVDNLIWSKKYGQQDHNDLSEHIFVTSTSIFLTGETNTSGISDLFLTKLDLSGNFQWQKTYDAGGTDYLRSSMLLKNNEILLCGLTIDTFIRNYASIFRIDTNGNIIWNKRFHLPSYYEFNAQAVNEDIAGNIILTGHVDTVSPTIWFGLWDIFLMKLSSSGNFQWAKIYGKAKYDEAWSVIPTKDNGFIMGAEPESFGNVSRISLLKTDSLGNMEWMRLYGKSSGGFPNNIVLNPDDGFTIFGTDGSYDEMAPMVLIKTDSLGITDCSDTLVTIFQNSFVPIEDNVSNISYLSGFTPYSPIVLDLILKPENYCLASEENTIPAVSNFCFVSPNPFQAILNISILKSNFKDLNFTIRNVLGQIIYSNKIYDLSNFTTYNIDLDYLISGFYFLEIIIDGKHFIKKIIKTKS